MADGDVMRYSDIIQPDGTLDELLLKMAEIIKTNKEMEAVLSSNAARIAKSLGTVSGATQQGRRDIDAAAVSAERLRAAYNNLNAVTADTDRLMASLRGSIGRLSGVSDKQKAGLEKTIAEYGRLKAEIAGTINVYSKLSDAQRTDPFGDKMLQNIYGYEKALQENNAALKEIVVQMQKTEAAQMRLKAVQDELDAVRKGEAKSIAEITVLRKNEEKALRQEVEIRAKLASASDVAAAAADMELARRTKVRNEVLRNIEVKRLQLQINSAEKDSYDALSLEYDQIKLKLRSLSQEYIFNTEEGAKLLNRSRELREQMQRFQEATGIHALNVGNYSKSFQMLRFQTAQVIREIPAAAVSLNTFFLAISNNIPMLLDQMRNVRMEIDLAKKAGKEYTSMGKQMAKAIFNWQTAVVVALFALSKYGKQMVDWIGQMIRGRNAVMSLNKALKETAKKIKDTDGGHAKNIITVMRLRDQWKALNTEAEKAEWLKDHQQDFRQLGLAIDSVNDAESLFVKNTSAVLTAYAKRAAAAAAESLAQEKIKEAISKQAEAATKAKQQGLDENGYRDAIRQAIARDNTVAGGLGISLTGLTEEEADEVQGLVELLAELKTKYKKLHEAKNISARLAAGETGAGTALAQQESQEMTQLMSQMAELESRIKGITGAQVIKLDAVQEVNRKFREVRNLQTMATRLLREGMQYFEIMRSFEEDYDKLLQEFGFGGGGRKGVRDITEPERTMDRNVKTKFAEATTDLITSQYDKAVQATKDAAEKKKRELEDIMARNNEWLLGLASGKYTVQDAKNMLGKTVEEIEDDNRRAAAAILAIDEKLSRDLEDLQVQRAIDEQKLENQNLQRRLNTATEGSREYYELQKQLLQGEENIAVWSTWLNRDENMQEDLLALKKEFLKKNADLDYQWQLQELEAAETVLQAKLKAVSETDHILREAYESQILELQRQIERLKNERKAAEQQVPPETIDADYDRRQRLLQGRGRMAEFKRSQSMQRTAYASGETSGRKGGPGRRPNEYKMNLFDLRQQREAIDYQLALWREGLVELSDEAVAEMEAQKSDLDLKIKKSGPLSSFAEHGLFGGVLEQMGLDHEQIDALNQAKDIVIDALNEIAEAEVEAAQRAVEAQQERVEAAQSAYDAEVQARTNGYANNVATAKKEMEQEKRRLAQKQKLLEEAERRKEALDSLSQVSSLVTATASIWQAFAGMGPAGPILAGLATAAMFSAFIAAKIKSRQVAMAADKYGEGGLEFLEGGSHASGNDIDLGTRNRRGRRMRAEGGEALAVINRRQTRRYRKVLPDIIDSLNRGVFENRFAGAFSGVAGITLGQAAAAPDLSALERDVRGIRALGEERCYMMPDGTLVVQRGNVKRYIRR